MQIRVMLTPLERNAINSLSAESRPNTSRIAVNNPHGIVKMNENGNTYAINVIRYSTGTSWFTSSGSSFRKMFPTTRTRLSTAIANATLTSNSRLTNRSISFICSFVKSDQLISQGGSASPKTMANQSPQAQISG